MAGWCGNGIDKGCGGTLHEDGAKAGNLFYHEECKPEDEPMRSNQVTRNEIIDAVNTWSMYLDDWNKSRNVEDKQNYERVNNEIEDVYGMSGAGLVSAATGISNHYNRRDGSRVEVIDVAFLPEPEEDLLDVAGRMYDPERHDPDSIFSDDSYTGPSERELMGGCNRCGGLDDCYCL